MLLLIYEYADSLTALLIYGYADLLTTLLIYEHADSLMTFLTCQYVDVLTISQAYENVLLYVYRHSVHFLEYLPDCKNYFEFCNIQRDGRGDYKNKINIYQINIIKSYKKYISAIILLIAIILYENDIKNAVIHCRI